MPPSPTRRCGVSRVRFLLTLVLNNGWGPSLSREQQGRPSGRATRVKVTATVLRAVRLSRHTPTNMSRNPTWGRGACLLSTLIVPRKDFDTVQGTTRVIYPSSSRPRWTSRVRRHITPREASSPAPRYLSNLQCSSGAWAAALSPLQMFGDYTIYTPGLVRCSPPCHRPVADIATACKHG